MRADSLYRRAARAAVGHPAATALVGIMALYILTRLLFLTRVPVFFDESIYIRWTQELIGHGKFLVSLTDGKPPLHIWWMAPFVRVVGDPLLAGRLASVFAGGLTTLGMFLLGREMADWKLGAWASLLYVVCPFALWYDRLAITEGLLLTTFVFAAWIAVRAARTLELWWSIPLGVVLGLALLTKGTANLLFLFLPFAFLGARESEAGVGDARLTWEPEGGRDAGGAPVRAAPLARRLPRWAAVLAASYLIGYGLYSLLRLSAKFPLIGARTSVATKSLGEVLRHPFDLFFSNLGTIGGTLVVFLTPVLFAVAVAGLLYGLARRWRPAGFLLAWSLVVVVGEALVAKHWMFDTILPRFFLSVLPPLLLGAGYLAGLVSEALRQWRPGRKVLRALVALVLLVALLAFPLVTDALILASPQDAVLPYWIRVQYLTDWPSGWGIKESAAFLERLSVEGPVTAGSNIRGIGLPTYGLEMYLERNTRVHIVPFSFTASAFPAELAEASRSMPTYVVFNSFPEHGRPPAGWPLRLLKRFPKDGNDRQALYLYRVVPPG